MEEIVYELVFQVVYQALKPLLVFLHRDSFLYWPFLVSTLLIAMLTWRFTRARGDLDFSKPHWKEFFHRYLSRRLWWHASSRLDYRFYFINAILFPLTVGPLLFSTDSIATALGGITGMPNGQPGPPSYWAVLAYTVAFFVTYDLGRFIAHSLLHDVPWLWQFHKVHHSAEVLTPITAFRAHPVDLAVMAWVPALTTGLVAWGFHHYVNAGIGIITFLGLHAIIWVCNLVGNLRHWHVWLSYGPTLNRWLISPAHHQLHHSYEPRHLGCNRGFELAVWDRLYGTLYLPPETPETFRMGLGDGSDGQWRTVWQLYAWPFQMLRRRPKMESKGPQQSGPGSSET